METPDSPQDYDRIRIVTSMDDVGLPFDARVNCNRFRRQLGMREAFDVVTEHFRPRLEEQLRRAPDGPRFLDLRLRDMERAAEELSPKGEKIHAAAVQVVRDMGWAKRRFGEDAWLWVVGNYYEEGEEGEVHQMHDDTTARTVMWNYSPYVTQGLRLDQVGGRRIQTLGNAFTRVCYALYDPAPGAALVEFDPDDVSCHAGTANPEGAPPHPHAAPRVPKGALRMLGSCLLKA